MLAVAKLGVREKRQGCITGMFCDVFFFCVCVQGTGDDKAMFYASTSVAHIPSYSYAPF